MGSMREIARKLLREYRDNHTSEADNPVMRALQVRDDAETAAVFDNRLTGSDVAQLKSWGVTV